VAWLIIRNALFNSSSDFLKLLIGTDCSLPQMIQAVSGGGIPDGLFQRFVSGLRKDRQMKTACVTLFFEALRRRTRQ
jgi:hypothetical protein